MLPLLVQNEAMKKIAISLCLLYCASAVHAENWVKQADTPHLIYIDFDSLRYEDGLASFLEKEAFPTQVNTRLPPTYQQQIFFNQTVSLQILNCERLAVTRVETRYLDDTSKVVADQRFDGSNWGPVRADSWLYGALKNICPAKGLE